MGQGCSNCTYGTDGKEYSNAPMVLMERNTQPIPMTPMDRAAQTVPTVLMEKDAQTVPMLCFAELIKKVWGRVG